MANHEVIIPPGYERIYERWGFAPAVRVGDTIYVSGVIGTQADGAVPQDFAEEAANAFAGLTATLEFAGASLDDVVELTSFHVDLSETLPIFMRAKGEAMSEPHAAWTAIGCTELAVPGARAEVKATAVVTRRE